MKREKEFENIKNFKKKKEELF